MLTTICTIGGLAFAALVAIALGDIVRMNHKTNTAHDEWQQNSDTSTSAWQERTVRWASARLMEPREARDDH